MLYSIRQKAWCLMPAFILVVIICAVICLGAAAVFITTSDLCHENPDRHMLTLLEDQKEQFQESVAYDFMKYYVGGCKRLTKQTTISRRHESLFLYFDNVAPSALSHESKDRGKGLRSKPSWT